MLGHAARRQDCSVRHDRKSRLLHELLFSHAGDSYLRLLRSQSRASLLICDDWLSDPLNPAHARDLLEILDDRYSRAPTLVATQIVVEGWHARVPGPSLADALLNCLVHYAYRLGLKRESMRKPPSPLQLPASREYDGITSAPCTSPGRPA